MRKGVTALHNIRLLKWCAEIGVDPQWNLLFGLPGEPPEEYERMADLIPSLVHLKPPALCPIQIQRFSPYYQRSADFGIEIVGPVPYYLVSLWTPLSITETRLSYGDPHD
ncbi:hypothetical protein ABH994_005555 [Bradyrhizobium yuanmingense]